MVIDTNLFIEHLRAPDKAHTVLSRIPEGQWAVSSITVYELFAGATSSQKAADVVDVLSGQVVLPFGFAEAQEAARLRLALLQARSGLPDVRDLFIAATCLIHTQPLLTRNIRHFERVPGLRLAEV